VKQGALLISPPVSYFSPTMGSLLNNGLSYELIIISQLLVNPLPEGRRGRKERKMKTSPPLLIASSENNRIYL